jgi:hypothetical protein
VGIGKQSGGWSDLEMMIDAGGISDHFDVLTAPMQLRLLSGQVIGTNAGGADETGMIRIQMRAERGDFGCTSHMSLA